MKLQSENTRIYIPALSIKPHYSYGYATCISHNQRRSPLPCTHTRLNELSYKAQRRITNAMQWLIHLSPKHKCYCNIQKRHFTFHVNFITLTLSAGQAHTDKFILDHVLDPFLKWLKRKGVTLYIWKAETQDNGNIHFHITTNHYIHWKSIRNKWNQLQDTHGYLKRFFDSHGHHDPNSTDVKAVKNTKQIISYMSKYLRKLDKFKKKNDSSCALNDHIYMKSNYNIDESGKSLKRTVECAIWRCSSNLANLKYTITAEHELFNQTLEAITQNSEVRTAKHGTIFLHNNNFSIDTL